MKSPEKKKARKSTSQAAGFSHLTEFAPPPTPMVDHLVASNPFDDDFGPPSRPSGAGGPGPFLPNAGPGGAGGGYGRSRGRRGATPTPRFGIPPQQQHGQGGHPFNSPPLPGAGGPRGPPHGPLPPMGGGMGPGMNMMGGMGGGPGSNMVGGMPGMPSQGQFPPSQDGPYPGPSPPGPGGEDGKNFGAGGPPPGPQQQQQLSLNPNGPPPPNTTPGPPPNSGPPQPGGGFPGHHDVQQTNTSTPVVPPRLHGPDGAGVRAVTRESAAVWACDFCIKTKDIQAVFVRQGLGQLVAANES
ncbi:unnamed protein product, partial [Tetraodon nigroviridis]